MVDMGKKNIAIFHTCNDCVKEQCYDSQQLSLTMLINSKRWQKWFCESFNILTLLWNQEISINKWKMSKIWMFYFSGPPDYLKVRAQCLQRTHAFQNVGSYNQTFFVKSFFQKYACLILGKRINLHKKSPSTHDFKLLTRTLMCKDKIMGKAVLKLELPGQF